MDLDLLLQRLREAEQSVVRRPTNDDWRIRKHNELVARKADKDAQRKICGAKTRVNPGRPPALQRGDQATVDRVASTT